MLGPAAERMDRCFGDHALPDAQCRAVDGRIGSAEHVVGDGQVRARGGVDPRVAYVDLGGAQELRA
ncbi:hypothetical protein [Propionicimonas sp.]|uniref:hypothetical protein n=1 Tax=Propionicimonas sp. TaxID=1955623 RepID=UPI003D123E4D